MFEREALGEKRTCERQRESRAIEWRATGLDLPRWGWMLESSETGMAFAWRGTSVPKVNSLLDMCEFPEVEQRVSYPARVVRVERAHEDLMVIGVERLRPFPPPAVALVGAPAEGDGNAYATAPTTLDTPRVVVKDAALPQPATRKAA